MQVSIHELIKLNTGKFVLNPYAKLFEYDGKNYAYLNRFPGRISFLELSNGMLEVLKRFDGNSSVSEIIDSYSLDADFFNLLKQLYINSFLKEKDKPEKNYQPGDINIVFFPTTTCNLRCVYCYANAGDNPAIFLDFEKAKTWIDYFFDNIGKEKKTVRVIFHGGGEPTNALGLIKKIWEEVKKRCENTNLTPILSSITNGNFNEKVLDWLIEEKAKTNFSLDGIKDIQDKFRPRADGKGSFQPAYNNLKRLSAEGLITGIRCTVTKSNLYGLTDLIDLGKECGVNFIDFEPCSSFGRSDLKDETDLSYNEFKEKFWEAWIYALEKGVTIRGFPLISLHPGRDYFCIDYANTSFSITPEGLLSSCPEVSLKSDPVSDVFICGKINEENKVEFYQERINSLKERNSRNISPCRDCFLEHICNCGCSLKDYRKYQSLLRVDEKKCEYIKDLSMRILKTMQKGGSKIQEVYNLEHFEYSHKNNKDIHADYVVFNPVKTWNQQAQKI